MLCNLIKLVYVDSKLLCLSASQWYYWFLYILTAAIKGYTFHVFLSNMPMKEREVQTSVRNVGQPDFVTAESLHMLTQEARQLLS